MAKNPKELVCKAVMSLKLLPKELASEFIQYRYDSTLFLLLHNCSFEDICTAASKINKRVIFTADKNIIPNFTSSHEVRKIIKAGYFLHHNTTVTWHLDKVMSTTKCVFVSKAVFNNIVARNTSVLRNIIHHRLQLTHFCNSRRSIIIVLLLFIGFIAQEEVLWFVFTILLIGKLSLFVSGILIHRKPHHNTIAPHANNLPMYSILVALYKEENSLPQLVTALSSIIYPKPLLEIYIILEEDDITTINLLREMQLPFNMQIMLAPGDNYKTKPRAINYGFQFITGEYIAIYDAEDIPDTMQILQALETFERYGDKCAALQGILTCYNHQDSLIARMFSLEYSGWFIYLIQAASKADIFIPLGGTTNHCRTAIIEQIGMWNSGNVTEDLELAMQIYQNGNFIGFFNSITQEEAVTTFKAFINQRSRWLKGYIISSVEYIAVGSLRNIFSYTALGFYIFCMLTILSPLINIFTVLWLLHIVETPYIGTQLTFIALSALCFLQYVVVSKAIHRNKLSFAILDGFLYLLYYLLHSIAFIKAIWQIFTKPQYWEKTTHQRLINQHIK
jgi:cellulose synthase/poly-beta-1,6-N-acetylglucosamine synthase-like glycosyltransferase